MTNSLKKKLKGILETEQKKREDILRRALKGTLEGLSAGGMRYAAALEDDADAEANGAEPLAIYQTHNCTETLPLIRTALARMKDGGYGQCPGCGQKILEKRLRAVPWAKYCLSCAELQAYGHRTPAEEGVQWTPVQDFCKAVMHRALR
jgi:DnaK suppressor protein